MTLIQRLAKKLGSHSTQKHGEEFIFSCPECERKKLSVNPAKRVFHCFRCSYSGTLDALFISLGIDERRQSSWSLDGHAVEDVKAPFKLPKFVVGGPLNSWAASFLVKKGIDGWRSTEMGMGMGQESYLRGRLIIPICEGGKICTYVARSVDGRDPKEISGPNKSQYVYGLDAIQEMGEFIIIVEGIFDCEAVRRSGLKAVAILGSSISDVQVGKILAKKPRAIGLMFDGDEAGREGARLANKKFMERTRIGIFYFWLPDGMDPDELSKEEISKLEKVSDNGYEL